jgi:large subunit ribosomal protein L17
MRHNRQMHRLGRNHTERQAMLENMVTSLLKHQQIRTTLQKAKAAQRLAEKVITLGKQESLAAKRQAFSYLQDHQLTSKLFNEVAPRFKNRKGGYTRILHLERRKGDGAQLALLELTEKEIRVKEAPKKGKKDAKGKPDAHAGHAHPHADEPKTHGPESGKHEKHDEPKKGGEKPQKQFFKNIGKFFRNKGGG